MVHVFFEDAIVTPLLAKSRKLVGTFKDSTSLSEQLSNTIRSNARPLYIEEDDEVDLEIGIEELVNISSCNLRTK